MTFDLPLADPPVTICRPGKRAGLKLRPPIMSSITITTQTALVSPAKPRLASPAAGDRRSAQERVEAAEREEAMSVVLAQPHRGGSDDPRAAFPLWRFCAAAWGNDHSFGGKMYAAGVSYAKEIRAVHVARGFHVIGCEKERKGGVDSLKELSRKEIEALQAHIFALERTVEKANQLLRDVMPRLPNSMVRLCFDNDEPSPYDVDILRAGLWRLALHYRHLEPSPNYLARGA